MEDLNQASDSLELYVTLAVPGDGALVLRMSQDLHAEVVELLDEHGLQHSGVLEHSATTDLVVEAVKVIGAAGGLGALASILSTILKRHDGKCFLMERNGEKFEAAGYPEAAVKRLVEEAAEKQADREANWERLKGQAPKPPTPDGDAQ